MDTQEITKLSSDHDPVAQVFNRLKTAYRNQPFISYQQRREVLQKIEALLLENDEAICEAVHKDFGGVPFMRRKYSKSR